uniref:Uncharacterized protein n=1 Tax=Ciona savignyi TaxID=51511 RepID=H2YF46_CIOSA
MLKTRLDQLENQNDSLQNQLSTSQEEEKKARNNLKISTDKLKKLVSLGLNEQMVLAKYEDYKQKHSDLETTNALLKEELEKLESRVSGRKEPNLNNNNILLKGVSMIHATTQTKEEMRATSPPSMRIRRSSPAPR